MKVAASGIRANPFVFSTASVPTAGLSSPKLVFGKRSVASVAQLVEVIGR